MVGFGIRVRNLFLVDRGIVVVVVLNFGLLF